MQQPWKEELHQIFGAYVRQETLESAAEEMAANGRAYPEMHEEFVITLSKGIAAAAAGDMDVCHAIEESGFYCSETIDAEMMCRELLSLYEDRYSRR